MVLEIFEIDTETKYTDIRNIFDQWAKKKNTPINKKCIIG